MPIWKEQTASRTDSPGALTDTGSQRSGDHPSGATATPQEHVQHAQHVQHAGRDARESILAADLTIEGKIEGAGSVRLAGHFKGDVNVAGNLTIERGAKVTGSVRASTVVIAGELEGNVSAAARVELLESAVVNGDLRAGTLSVAVGSRMRGQVMFGIEEGATAEAAMPRQPEPRAPRVETASAA